MNKKYSKAFLHILIWTVFFLMPILTIEKDRNFSINDLGHLWMPLIEAAIIFYINYFLLVEKWLFKKPKYVVFIVINALIIIFFRFDMMIVHLITGSDLHNGIKVEKINEIGNKEGHGSRVLSLIKSFVSLVFPILLAVTIKITELWQNFEFKKKMVENLHLESELTNLKYQLQPHFFFNSLNNIYSLVEISPIMAQQSIHNLSKLMRYMLYETKNEKTDLYNEINFLKNYVEIMRVKFSEDVEIDVNFPEIKLNSFQIAPLLFIPIFENAFKHGISPTEASKLLFDMSISNNKLTLVASNINYADNQSDLTSSGIGLENLKKRLELIYKNKYIFSINNDGKVYNLKLEIELQE